MPPGSCKKKCYTPCCVPPVNPCVRNAQNVQNAINAFRTIVLANSTTNTSSSILPFSSLFAAGGTFTFYGSSAAVGPVTFIPFAGIYNVSTEPSFTTFFNQVGTSGITFAVGAPRDLTLSPDCLTLTSTVDVTFAPRCGVGGTQGPTSTLVNVIVFKFNAFGQIVSANVYTDTSGLALFYATACPPL